MPEFPGNAALAECDTGDRIGASDVKQVREDSFVGAQIVAGQTIAVSRAGMTVNSDHGEAFVGGAVAETGQRTGSQLAVPVVSRGELIFSKEMDLADSQQRAVSSGVAANEQHGAMLVQIRTQKVAAQSSEVVRTDPQLTHWVRNHACVCSTEPSAVSRFGFQLVWRSDTCVAAIPRHPTGCNPPMIPPVGVAPVR